MPNEYAADFTELSEAQRDDLAALLKKLYIAVDRFFDGVRRPRTSLVGTSRRPTLRCAGTCACTCSCFR